MGPMLIYNSQLVCIGDRPIYRHDATVTQTLIDCVSEIERNDHPTFFCRPTIDEIKLIGQLGSILIKPPDRSGASENSTQAAYILSRLVLPVVGKATDILMIGTWYVPSGLPRARKHGKLIIAFNGGVNIEDAIRLF